MRKVIGYWGEEQAKLFLERKGYLILHQNWKAGLGGELDLIISNPSHLVFVEVKTRHISTFQSAELSISSQQQKKLIEMGNLYLQYFPQHLKEEQEVRFDSIGITFETYELFDIVHLEDAFGW